MYFNVKQMLRIIPSVLQKVKQEWSRTRKYVDFYWELYHILCGPEEGYNRDTTKIYGRRLASLHTVSNVVTCLMMQEIVYI
jgi:hypothetical protein